MSGETLPGAPEAAERIVLHVDMDCFYASCERLRDPNLEREPVVVGMGYEDGEDHGAVATASYEAREHGVESAQAISQALERLPRAKTAGDAAPTGHYRTVDMEYYKSVASEVKQILHDCADVVREVSIDEAYLDATEQTAWDVVEREDGTPKESTVAGATGGVRTLAEGFARHVKARIGREVGVPASVGVAPNMSTAKLASDYDKPDGLVVVRPNRVREFLDPLLIEDLHGVGPVTARDLHAMGVETASDLAEADPAALRDRFGERGRELYERARGNDGREVTPADLPKSLSRESAFTEATTDVERKRERVRTLAADVAERTRSRGALYGTIGIKVIEPPYDVSTRAHSLSGPVDDPDLLEEVALELLAEFEEKAVRKLGVRVSSLDFAEADQARLDGWDEAESAGDATDNETNRSTDEVAVDGGTDNSAASGGETNDREASDGSENDDRTDDATDDRTDDATDDRSGDGAADDGSSDDATAPPDGQISLGDFD